MKRYAYGLVGLFIATAFFTILNRNAFAVDFYIDGSCANDGNGRADQCASASGGSGAYKDPQSCLDAMSAGDTCYIKNGTYTTNYTGSDPREYGGYHFTRSGNSTAWITLKNYPGHSPLLRNCASPTSECSHPTITTAHNNYIIIEGLRIQGGLALFGGQYPDTKTGLIVRNNDVSVGWMPLNDGNWSGIFMSDWSAPHLHHNYIHDISMPGGNGSSASCIKWYQIDNGINEYNTCLHNYINSQAGGVDDKARAVNNIHRYNWIEDVNVCFRINNQLPSQDISIYGNVCANTAGAFVWLIQGVTGLNIYNNTAYNVGRILYVDGGDARITQLNWYNNILKLSPTGTNNIEMYNAGVNPFSIANYNAYTGGFQYRASNGSWYSTLSAFRSALGGVEANSQEITGGVCSFTNALGGNFTLLSGSTCKNMGRIGGISTGAAIDLGAYGLVSCVGHLCGVSNSPPAAPKNLIVQ